jgi:ribosomal protein S18 acetylase RimI-like enzyme
VPEPVSTSPAVRFADPSGATAVLAVRTRGTTAEADLTWTDPPPDPQGPAVDAAASHLRALQHPAEGDPPVELVLAADHPADRLHPLPEALADLAGLTARRDLIQLRRPLPVPADRPARAGAPEIRTRSFRPGVDDDAWIRSNNRAFADHPDQGAETPATLAARLAEPWFDASGFRVLDDAQRPGELAGSCWTKVHPATDHDPALGEIYVIGVDPARQGEGLGPALVLDGLDHLARLGLTTAVLYVEESNTVARRLYEHLGFTTHARRRVYRAPDAAAGTAP